MFSIEKEKVEAYIRHREAVHLSRIVSLKLDEESTAIIRGRFAELQQLRKALEINFANPEGRNES